MHEATIPTIRSPPFHEKDVDVKCDFFEARCAAASESIAAAACLMHVAA